MKPSGSVPVPSGVVTDTYLVPAAALTVMGGQVVSLESLGIEMPEKIVTVKPDKDKDKSQD